MKHKPPYLRYLSTLISCLLLSPAFAENINSQPRHADISSLINSYTYNIYKEVISKNEYIIKHQFKKNLAYIKPCSEKNLTISHLRSNNLGSKLTLEVKCQHPQKWKIFIPIKIEIYADVAIAKRYLKPGTELYASDFILKRSDISASNGDYISDPKELINHTTRRIIPKGQIISRDKIGSGIYVYRGKEVTVIYKNSNITVKTRGKAMSDAMKGDHVKIKLSTNHKVVEAIVTARGVAELNF